MANERKINGPTLIENILADDLGGPRKRAFLTQMDRLIPWERLAQPVRKLYRNDTGKGGRANVPAVVMIKCLLVAKWFGLSDPQLEEQLLDSIAIRQFVGLGQDDAVVDETTMVTFRKRLREAGLTSYLFDETLAHLDEQGLVVHEGTIVDATIIQAPRGTKTRDASGQTIHDTRDRQASFTRKHDRPYHGYKGHIATDKRGVVKDYRFTTASEHDSLRFDEMTENEQTAVYGDSAYMSEKRKQALRRRGVHCGIIERRVRGQDALTAEQKAHNRRTSKVRAMVEHPFAWLWWMGQAVRVRYRGLRRNGEDFAWGLIAYNFKRMPSLMG